MQVQFTESQLDSLSSAKYVIINAKLSTANNQSVKIQANDYIKLSIGSDFKMNTNVNN